MPNGYSSTATTAAAPRFEEICGCLRLRRQFILVAPYSGP